jgi:hypothetical protein
MLPRRRQRGGGVAPLQPRQPLLVLRQPAVQGGDPRPQRLQRLRRGALEVAQLLEGLRLLVEPRVGGRGQLQHLGQHPPLRRLVLRHLVVELLAQRERAGQLLPRLRQRLGEPGDGGLAVLQPGEVEVELRGRHRLVELEQRGAGPALQLGGGHAGVRVGPLEPGRGRRPRPRPRRRARDSR